MASSFHPPLRPTRTERVVPTEPKGFWAALFEKDDILLYVTAALGVLMPGLVYIVYHRVHKAYMRYAKRKEAERLAEEKAKAELAIFYSRPAPHLDEPNAAEERAKELESYMGDEKPKMCAMDAIIVSEFSKFKGIGIFLIECNESGHPLQSYEWFLDWLETCAADKRERKKLSTEEMRYAILGMATKEATQREATNKAASTLSKRLRILGATPIVPERNFEIETKGYDAAETFKLWAEELFLAIDSIGDEEEYEDDEEEEYETSEEESVDEESRSDMQRTDDGMELRKRKKM